MKRVAREPTIGMMTAAHDRDVAWTPRAIWYAMWDAALDAAPDADDCVECDGTGDAEARNRYGYRVGIIESGCGECGGSGKAPDADAGRVFPIMNIMASIPWALIAMHEKQAIANHGQSLEMLASRGGLSTCEALAVIEDRPWRVMDQMEAAHRLQVLSQPNASRIAALEHALATERGRIERALEQLNAPHVGARTKVVCARVVLRGEARGDSDA
ncbi:MAG: hypothetical protein AB7O44_27560 [Hyphomicrobiaceae bacterium]